MPSSDMPRLTVKPTFVKSLVQTRILLKSGFGVVFITLWGAGFIGGLGSMFLAAVMGVDEGSFMPGIFVISGLVSLVGSVIATGVWYTLEQQAYGIRVLTLYDDEMELVDGLFNKQRKIIPYKNIREVVVGQGYLQAKYNVGTLSFITAAEEGGSSASGIRLADVANADAVYQQIRDILPSD